MGTIPRPSRDLVIAKEVGDRTDTGQRAGRSYGNLGCAYWSKGDFSKTIEHHTHRLAIAKEVGDRAGQSAAYGNLGNRMIQREPQRQFSHFTSFVTPGV